VVVGVNLGDIMQLLKIVPFRLDEGRAVEARLHTAVSSGEKYSIISVQRLDDLMVLRFFWLDFPSYEHKKLFPGLTVSRVL
jgi:hypothetical protein